MKKLKLLLVAFLLSFGMILSGQYVPDPSKIATVNITNNKVQNGWAHNGTTCAGCPAYWYQIVKSVQAIKAEDGNYYYYYYFYFFSDSYYSNGNPAGTYLSNINFYINGKYIFNIKYILLPAGQSIYAAWSRSQSGTAVISFAVSNMNVH